MINAVCVTLEILAFAAAAANIGLAAVALYQQRRVGRYVQHTLFTSAAMLMWVCLADLALLISPAVKGWWLSLAILIGFTSNGIGIWLLTGKPTPYDEAVRRLERLEQRLATIEEHHSGEAR